LAGDYNGGGTVAVACLYYKRNLAVEYTYSTGEKIPAVDYAEGRTLAV
jgi:hypothetical protein